MGTLVLVTPLLIFSICRNFLSLRFLAIELEVMVYIPNGHRWCKKKKKPTGFITLPYSIQKEKSFAYSSTLSIDWLASSLVSELRFY